MEGGSSGSTYGLYGLCAPSENEILAKGKNSALLRFVNNSGLWRLDTAFSPSGFDPSIISALHYLSAEQRLLGLAFANISRYDDKGNIISTAGGVLYEITGGDYFNAVAIAPLEAVTESLNGAGAVAYDPERHRLFVELSLNGYAAFSVPGAGTTIPAGWVLY